MMSLRFSAALLATTLLSFNLVSCGGSGGGDSAPAPVAATPPPTTPTTPPTGPTVPPTSPTSPTGGSGKLVTSVPAFTGTDTDRIAAYNRINAMRGACGFGLMAQNTQLETAAQNHGNYMGANYAAHPEVYSHFENPAYNTGFTGAAPTDRVRFAGYASSTVGEDIAQVPTTSTTPQLDGVNELLQAGYHLANLVGAGTYDMGLAKAILGSGILTVTVDTGSLPGTLQDIASNAVATYPCQGSVTTTSPYGIGHETPEPFPTRNYGTSPLGAPIYARVRRGQTIAITTFTVTSAGGTAIAPAALYTASNDPNHQLQANEALFFPNTPLAASTTYNVSIIGTNNGTPFTQAFTFGTT